MDDRGLSMLVVKRESSKKTNAVSQAVPIAKESMA